MKIFEGFQKGVNLGGWISQYDEFDFNHFDTFIQESDIKDIAALGFDHVRVPVDYIVLEEEDGTTRERGFSYLDSCRDWCKKYGIHMIIDLHETFGYSFDPLKDMDRKAFFYSEDLQARFLSLWERIVKRYGDDYETIAFEPLNEVVLFEVHEAWNGIIKKYIELVRKYAPKAYIIVGGVCYNSVSTVELLDAPYDDKIVYNFHCYEPLTFTHQGAYWIDTMAPDFRIGYPATLEDYRKESMNFPRELVGNIFRDDVSEIGPAFFEDIFAPALKVAEKYDVPLYCGEYGVIDLANNEDKIRWLKDINSVFKKYGIGRSLWNYKEKDFGFVDPTFASVRDEFMKVL